MPALSILGKSLAFVGKGVAEGFLGAAGGMLFGTLLDAVGLSQAPAAPPLAQAQLDALGDINATLTTISNQLTSIDATLTSIDAKLSKLITLTIYQSWSNAQDLLDTAAAQIQTDWDTYTSYVTVSGGAFPKVTAAQFNGLSQRAYAGPVNDETYATQIHQAVVGLTGKDGLLHLYRDVLLDCVTQALAGHRQMGSDELAELVDGFSLYFAQLIDLQLKAATLVVETKRKDGVSAALIQTGWDTHLNRMATQCSLFLSLLLEVVFAWRGTVIPVPVFQIRPWPTTAPVGYPPPVVLSREDQVHFFSGLHAQPLGPAFQYSAALQDQADALLRDAELLVQAATFPQAGSGTAAYRVVVWAMSYSAALSTQLVLNSQIATLRLLEDPTVNPVVSVYQSNSVFGSYTFHLFAIRYTFDVTKAQTYHMANVNAKMPGWVGYNSGTPISFQSADALAIGVAVSPQDPVGFMRFVPYVGF